MEITTHWYGDALVTQVDGALDHDNGRRLMDHLMVALQKLESGAAIVDLAHVPYVSSSGLRALVTAARTAQEAGTRLLVAAAQPMVADVFKLSQAHLVLQVFADVGEATAAVSPQSRDAYDKASR
ncbi:MAG TPA: STAS domain-containing protein [Usitatibacter sp.]|nr:STAS domain-containing protein [Usitatibacter sp.]